MFRCERCGKREGLGKTPVRVVTKTRPRVYHPGRDQRKGTPTTGVEVVEEKNVCEECALALAGGADD